MLLTLDCFYAFIIGSCIGSFINVIVYRLPNNFSIVKPRSFCPECKSKLTWRENVPLISWLIQKGRCKNCNTPISKRYPLIELSTAILFVIFTYSSPPLFNSSSNLIIKKSQEIKEIDIFKKKSKIARYLYQKGFESNLIWNQIEVLIQYLL